MRYLIFLILFLPCVSAMSVMPTEFDFGDVERGDIIERELYIEGDEYYVTADVDWIYYEDYLIVQPNAEDGFYEGFIQVTEVVETDSPFGVVNTIAIPYSLNIIGGEDIKDLDFEVSEITSRAVGVKVGDNEMWYGLALIIIVVIIFIVLLVKRKI